MAVATAFGGFNDLGRSVTPTFLSMGHFLYRFSTFAKNEKNISIRSSKFLQNAPLNSVHWTSSFSCVAV